MNFKEHETATKLRGGYYTPNPIARFLCRWVLASNPSTILEPSCGDGAFIRAMRGLHRRRVDILGIELLAEEATKAQAELTSQPRLSGKIIKADFLEWALSEVHSPKCFDAVLGNPPYIRYQYLSSSDQAFSEAAFARYELPFTKHTNAWVPFVILSISLLRPGGRLAMVIPAELLHVLHATSLRKYLLRECLKILIIDPNELLFKEALQGTVLLMAERKRSLSDSSEGVSIVAAPDNEFLSSDPDSIFDAARFVSGEILNGKWMKVLLSPDELDAFERVRKSRNVRAFRDIATVDVGIVTGANKFFLVPDATVAEYDLEAYASPMFGRSEHCPGAIYDTKVHAKNRRAGLPCNFINFGSTPLSKLPAGARRYLAAGEKDRLHARYKCRIRKPWYAVPSVYTTEIGMLKRSHNFPRLIWNSAGAYTTDTAYRIRSLGLSAKNLVFAFVNSLTALTAELEGRHYGGGVLELVPSEIERLLVPTPLLVNPPLARLDAQLREGVSADLILREQDPLVLSPVGISASDQATIHSAWARIRDRRHRLLGTDTDDRDND